MERLTSQAKRLLYSLDNGSTLEFAQLGARKFWRVPGAINTFDCRIVKTLTERGLIRPVLGDVNRRVISAYGRYQLDQDARLKHRPTFGRTA